MAACRICAPLGVHLHNSRSTRASRPALLIGHQQLVTGFEEAERTADALAEQFGDTRAAAKVGSRIPQVLDAGGRDAPRKVARLSLLIVSVLLVLLAAIGGTASALGALTRLEAGTTGPGWSSV
jgi:hypothetical protein